MPSKSPASGVSASAHTPQRWATFFSPVSSLRRSLIAIVAVEQDGTIVQVNSQTETLFGYSKGALIGQKIEVLVPMRFRDRHHNIAPSSCTRPKFGAWARDSICTADAVMDLNFP